MQVNPSHHNDPVGQTEFVRRPATPQKGAADNASFDSSTALNRALSQTPDVRPDAVARARQLIADVNYPPAEAIRKISDLLAMKIQNETGE
jgi:hypothetical protein